MSKFKSYRAELTAELKSDVLSVVTAEAPITVREIAKQASMSWATAKHYLDLLENEGFVVSKRQGWVWIYTLGPAAKGEGRAIHECKNSE